MQYNINSTSAQDAERLISLIASRRPGKYVIRLNLPLRPVFIGELLTDGDGTFIKRVDPSKHLHRNSDSIAISAALLHAEDIQFRWVVCDVAGRGRLVTTRAYLLGHGVSHCFRGYEPQIFLPITEWGREKALTWEQEQERERRRVNFRRSQLDLFVGAAA